MNTLMVLFCSQNRTEQEKGNERNMIQHRLDFLSLFAEIELMANGGILSTKWQMQNGVGVTESYITYLHRDHRESRHGFSSAEICEKESGNLPSCAHLLIELWLLFIHGIVKTMDW